MSIHLTIWLSVQCGLPFSADGQVVHCDPHQVMTADACAKCHINETLVWKSTPHFRTFDELGRRPEAKEICAKLGLRSVKRSDVCVGCHFTAQASASRTRPVSGVSCESCHGAAQEWITQHNDFGGPTATRETETADHAAQRHALSIELGMNNTRDLYSIASNCYHCHTIPNESLVNVGGHTATSDGFELVSWSQGKVRHNFLRTGGRANAVSSPARTRVMYIVGLIADLEFSTRATAKATSRSTYGIQVANRAAQAAIRLYHVQEKIHDPHVQSALVAFSQAELRINNAPSLLAVADKIRLAGKRFSIECNGDHLSVIDSMLPDPSLYK